MPTPEKSNANYLFMTRKHFLRRILQATVALPGVMALTLFAAPGGVPPGLANPRVQEVMALQGRITSDLMSLEGILGTAVGEDESGEIALLVFVNQEAGNHGEIMRALPAAIRGVRVSGQLTEPFRAMPGKPGGGGVSHTAKQTPPIQLGTSGGWGDDLANGYCCGGTLGSLISIDGEQYILSNFHVLEADKVLGGNNKIAETGDPVIQPGLIDVNCVEANAQPVATLVVKNSLPDNNVDCAIAKVNLGMVDPLGAILEIGTISSQTTPAAINQAVKKSGRTSGLTRSKVAGLNATVNVAYEDECAGAPAFTKTFTGQIVINNRNKGSEFLKSGDSGSLMVQDVATNPKAVGLLFAGSSTYAIANPIDEVLAFCGQGALLPATMVGVP